MVQLFPPVSVGLEHSSWISLSDVRYALKTWYLAFSEYNPREGRTGPILVIAYVQSLTLCLNHSGIQYIKKSLYLLENGFS